MNELLSLAQAEGTQDSEGVFSIDPESAREKFREFGLEQEHDYVCVLYSALVDAGASYVDVEADSDDFILRADFYCSSHDLEQLFSLGAGSGSRHYFKLALGLQATLELKPSKVEVETWDGTAGGRLLLRQDGTDIERLTSSPWPDDRAGCRIHVRERPGLRTAQKYLGKRFLSVSTPEQALIRERCSRGLIPVTLNGEPITRNRQWGSCLAYVRVGTYRFDPRFLPELDPERPVIDFEHPEIFALFGLSRDSIWASQAELVVSGLSFDGWVLDAASYSLVVTEQLTADLSLTELVRDGRYEALREQLDQFLAKACETLFQGALSDEKPFQTSAGAVTYQIIKEIYEREGHLRVSQTVKETPEGPLTVLKNNRYIRLLFPRQKTVPEPNESIPAESYGDPSDFYRSIPGYVERTPEEKRLPPGDYLITHKIEEGSEVGILRECDEPYTNWNDKKFEPLALMSKQDIALPLPRGVVYRGVKPSLGIVARLYQEAMKKGCLSAAQKLDFLCYADKAKRAYRSELVYELSEFSRDDLPNLFEQILKSVKLATVGGSPVCLADLTTLDGPVARGKEASYPCYPRYTDKKLHFDQPSDETMLVDPFTFSQLKSLCFFAVKNYHIHRCGIIDKRGRFVCEPETVIRGHSVNSNRLSYKSSEGLTGYTDGNGIPVIAPSFTKALDFENGTAVVWDKPEQYQLIDVNGNIVSPTFTNIGSPDQRGRRKISSEKGWGYLNADGSILVSPRYGSILGLENDTFLVDEKMVVNSDGEPLSQFNTEPGVKLYEPLPNGLLVAAKEDKSGLLDGDGNWVVYPVYDHIWNLGEGRLALADQPGRWAVATTEGEPLTDFLYDFIFGPYSDGRLLARKESGYLYLDISGREALAGYTQAGVFSEGLAPVEIRKTSPGAFSYINPQGETVLEPRFSSAEPFSEGRAVVSP
jgi:hypothetical protein